jgi:hypothetical protein
MLKEKPGLNFTFLELEEPILTELKRPRTKEVMIRLRELMHPIWDAYLRYFLYYHKIYDTHSEMHEIYNDVYVACVDTLSTKLKVKTFGEIKVYYKRSIEGWIKNAIYHVKKKKIETVHDDALMNAVPEKENLAKEIEYKLDMVRINKHMKEQDIVYQELYGVVYGRRSREDCKKSMETFKGEVLENYMQNGELTKAQDSFDKRIGKMFQEE